MGLHEVIFARPDDPVSFLREYLSRRSAPRAVIVGPPFSGVVDVADAVAKQMEIPLIAPPTSTSTSALAEEQGAADAVIPVLEDAVKKPGLGWVLADFPRTKLHALLLPTRPTVLFHLIHPSPHAVAEKAGVSVRSAAELLDSFAHHRQAGLAPIAAIGVTEVSLSQGIDAAVKTIVETLKAS